MKVVRTHGMRNSSGTKKVPKATKATRMKNVPKTDEAVRRTKKIGGRRQGKGRRTPRLKRTYKDSMFRAIFKDKKNLLSLYNAVNGTNHANADDLEINTLENVIYMNFKNALSFIINLQLHLYEHQSSINPNMPLRDLFYVSKILEKIMKGKDLYSSALKKFPTPRFMVFYNGVEEMPERWEIRLSDAFEQPIKNPEFELVVTVLNINLGKNKKLMQACKALRDYATFVQRMRERLVEMTPEEAAERTIEECIENDVLADFLKKHREEAKEMCQCLYEYDEELHIREERKIAREAGWKEGWNGGREAGWKEGQEEGRKEGRKEGQEEGRKEGRKEGQEYGVWLEKSSVIYKLLGKNYGVSKIADMLDEDEAVIQKIADVLREFAPDEYDWKNVVKDLEGTGV